MPKYIKPILVRGAALLLSLTLSVSLLPVTVVASTGADQPDTCSPNTAEMINDTLAFLAGGQAENNLEERNDLAGKTLSILGASISTYEGTSNGAAADTTNSTIRSNAKYYPSTTVTDVTLNDTWWMQVVNDLGLRLLVNNSWSGSSLLHERSGTVGAYVDRCVQLHDDTGDNAGGEPDIIGIQMGTNDFQYYKDTLGTADIDYDTLITDNGDGTYAYAQPVTSLEAAAIVLHKISVRYPDAEVYYLNISQRVDGTDALIQSFNAELAAVCGHFGAHVVDIYGSAITMEEFDTYIGDGRVHPNKLGMDAYTEAFKAAVLANTAYSAETYTVSFDLTDASADYGTDKAVVSGDSFCVNLTADAGNRLDVTVTMGGEDITDRTYADGTVTIDAVTADVTITAKGVHEPQSYRWELTESGLTGESNALTLLEGTVTEGQFNKVRYKLSESIVLHHDLPWVMEWKSTGDMQNTSGNGARLFNNAELNNTEGAPYIFKSSKNYIIAMGERKNSTGQNYGVALADYGIDGSETHIYRLENRIAADGSNMVYLYVDGVEIGPMNHHYQALNDTGTTSDWINGRDFTFTYMGTAAHALTNCSIDYIQVWEGGLTHEIPENQGTADDIEHADNSILVTLTPDDYLTISNDDVEKLACGPGMVSYGDGNFAIAYLADEINSVETEASTTIVCRLGLFDLEDPETGTFINIAAAGQNIGGVTIGNGAPYEPNLMKLSDNELLVLFNLRDTSGSYMYYAARFDAVTNTITSYESLTLDGKSWTPENIAASYNAIADSSISTAGPSGSMVFTSKIIEHDGYYYGYCGGICSGFSGILVRSTDGINWTSVLAPEAVSDMAGVIECGFQFLDDYVYFCMRDIFSGVYHCSYRFSTKEQMTGTRKISGLTTSKPAAFIQDDKMYVIVNKNTGDDSTIGRRNTALFYQVDPATCCLLLARQVFCADGCAYHTVENFNGTNYWCFHTDARRINPYSQGRSNLAFLKIPSLFAMENGSTNGVLDLSGFSYMYDNGCITRATNTWQAGAVNMHYQIPLAYFADFDTVTVTANASNKAYLAFFTDLMTKEGAVAYAEGWTEQLILEPGAAQTLTIPTDAQFMYILATNAAGDDLLPESVVFSVTAEPSETLPLRYDDRLDLTGKTVEILDPGTPTSWQVGYGVEENTVPDAAVVTLDGDTITATGIGTAKVRMDGVLHEITVTAAPISLLLLVGQSNMRGSEGNANQSIICPDGMVYATYGDDRGADNVAMTVSNATQFAPSALTGAYSSINAVGTADCLSGYPVDTLTRAGAGKIGPDSGFAYEWVQQTGEKVWIVNAAHGGTSITTWQDGGDNYEEAVLLFSACQETLRKEIAAGHFTLSHMGYFWCQGCSDRTQGAEWYVKKYLAMHGNFKTELAFDHDSNPATAEKTFEFGGIIPVRVGSTATCYRDGVSSVSNPYAYHESFVDLRMNGPRVAQYWMINNPELADIWGVCDIGEDWVWMPDGTNGVSAYFQEHYSNGTVDYEPQVAQKTSWYTPTTPAAVHDSIHYNQIGYNEIGRESVRNALILLGEIEAPDAELSVELLTWDGYTEGEQVPASTSGSSDTLIVPVASPIWKAKEITVELSDGLVWNYYDLLAENEGMTGTLTSHGKTVNVVKRAPGSHFAGHLSRLPENVCCGLNLWSVLEHDEYYFASGTNWGIYSSGDVCSVTVPVNPGDRIFATSFGKAGENGHTSSNGIRTTFFSDYGVAQTLNPADTYAKFNANGGYLVAPEGSVAINIAMWNDSDDNEIYILNLPHSEIDEICTVCGRNAHIHTWSAWETLTIPTADAMGTQQRSCACGEIEIREVEGVWQKWNLSDHLSALPENLCCDTNLWTALEHDEEYFANGIDWGVHSSGQVYSVTIPVSAGDRIYASSFGAAGTNGSSSNGIRCTFFDAYGVAKTMTPAETFTECSANGYLTAPEGAVAVNVPMWTNSDAWELYILNREHSYQSGVCTGCGAKTALSDADDYAGKVISILGDSISTFAGYIPTADGFNLEHLARYPQDNLLTDVNETWWMQAITQLDAKLGINDSWRGATVSGAAPVTTGTTGENAAMSNLIRIQNLGSNGTPDVILFYGGTNDLAHVSKVGTFDPETAPAQVDLTTTKWDNLADGYVHTLLRLQHYYPDAVILAMLPTVTTSYYSNEKLAQANEVLTAICEHYGVPCVDLRYCGITTAELPDGIHPDATGMDYITDAVLNTLFAECEVTAGENVVYSVTHHLTNAAASLGHYKGVSAGEPFAETLSGENLAVTVTMGGEDVTSACYQNGRVTIDDVKGDIVISAKAVFSLGERLQQIPEGTCAGINLWNVLEPENEYYTGTGWGNVAGGGVYSVTIPVTSGQRLWATSFGASGTNGGSRNGIRLTWFDENGVLKSVAPDKVYSEFAASGYVAVPAGATAANVVMWNGSESNELYVLTLTHSFGDWELVTAPTYTQTGLEQRVCAYGCGTVETQIVPATGPALVEAVGIVYDDQMNTVHLTDVPEGLTVVLAIYENDRMVYADLHSDTGENTSFDLPSGWDGATASAFFLTSEWQPIGQSRTIF